MIEMNISCKLLDYKTFCTLAYIQVVFRRFLRYFFIKDNPAVLWLECSYAQNRA